MRNFWKIANFVINKSDILLIVADARFPKESINNEVVDKIRSKEKKLIFVFNKCDLIDKKQYLKLKEDYPKSVIMSAKEHLGNMKLLRAISQKINTIQATVGVLGYPNTGKSSIINAIKGKKSAPVSPVAGYTKAMQLVRVSRKIKLLDTPGVIPYKNRNKMMQAYIAALDINKMKDPSIVAQEIIEFLDGIIEDYYNVPKSEDTDETLEKIAVNLNLLKKGNKPDLKRASRKIILDWQKGKIRK